MNLAVLLVLLLQLYCGHNFVLYVQKVFLTFLDILYRLKKEKKERERKREGEREKLVLLLQLYCGQKFVLSVQKVFLTLAILYRLKGKKEIERGK